MRTDSGGHAQTGAVGGAQVTSTPGDSPEEKGISSAWWTEARVFMEETAFRLACEGQAGPEVLLLQPENLVKQGLTAPTSRETCHVKRADISLLAATEYFRLSNGPSQS